MSGISVECPVDDRATAPIHDLAKRIAHIDPVLDEIGSMLVTSVQQRFEAETDPDGEPWVPLAEVTKERRKAPDPKILREHGELYDSITHKVVSKRGVLVGTNRIYARVHQLGSSELVDHPIPARPYLGMNADDEKEVLAILTDHLALELA